MTVTGASLLFLVPRTGLELVSSEWCGRWDLDNKFDYNYSVNRYIEEVHRDGGAEVARLLLVAAFLRYNRLREECASPSAAALPDRPTLVSHRPKSDGHVARYCLNKDLMTSLAQINNRCIL